MEISQKRKLHKKRTIRIMCHFSGGVEKINGSLFIAASTPIQNALLLASAARNKVRNDAKVTGRFGGNARPPCLPLGTLSSRHRYRLYAPRSHARHDTRHRVATIYFGSGQCTSHAALRSARSNK